MPSIILRLKRLLPSMLPETNPPLPVIIDEEAIIIAGVESIKENFRRCLKEKISLL
jgi:hypothetical protein